MAESIISPKKARKILIVEDEKPMAQALELKLRRAGFDAECEYDGASALERLSRDVFDFVVLDLVLPGVDGFHVLQRLKEQGSKVPVVVVSNLGQDEDMKRARELGAIGYFIKSDTPIASVVNYINKHFRL